MLSVPGSGCYTDEESHLHRLFPRGRAARLNFSSSRLRRSGVCAGFLLATVSCAPQQAASLPGPVVVDVKMTEYRFGFDPARLRPGRVLFKARNEGRLSHQMVLVALPPELPPIVEQLNAPERKAVTQVARFPPKRPGTTAAFAVDLQPGRYALICFVPDPDGKQHGAKGMASEFRIR